MTKRAPKTPPKIVKKRYSRKLALFVADQIRKGLLLPQQVKKYKDYLPTEGTLYAWMRKHAEFKSLYLEAKQDYYRMKEEELEVISKTPATELYPDVSERVAMQTKKDIMQALSLQITRIMPRYIPEMVDKQKIEHENAPNIIIQTWDDNISTKSMDKTDDKHKLH